MVIKMKVKNLNSSSIKTQKLIKNTLAELISEKGELQKITVTELVSRADITRGTFYTHYDNIYEVASEIQDELLDVLIIDTEELKTIDDINNYFDKVINHLKENENFYSMFLSSNEPLLFTQRLSKIMDKKLNAYFRLKQQPDVSLAITFFIDGCINLVIKYFKKNIDTNLDEINKCIKNLFLKIFYN